jgi:GT2 family glycosyltransferase
MDLSIICVNWNSVDYMRTAIATIRRYTHNVSYEIIVIDNASPDGRAGILKDEFPEIQLVESHVNLGFARANNLGFKHASGRCLLFLNPDTELVGPAIDIMMKHMDALPGAGAAGCKLLNSDGSIQTSCVQTFPTIMNQLLDIDYLRVRWPHCKLWDVGMLFSENRGPVRVEMISGACLMVSRNVFERVNMFSEEYFMYADDVDLCYKIQSLGLNNYYIGDATVIHHGGKSSSQRSANQWSVIMKFNSIFQFCVKTRGWFYGLIYRLAMAGSASVRLLLLGILFIVRSLQGKASSLRYVTTKWIAVLKWSLGLKNWTLQNN